MEIPQNLEQLMFDNGLAESVALWDVGATLTQAPRFTYVSNVKYFLAIL